MASISPLLNLLLQLLVLQACHASKLTASTVDDSKDPNLKEFSFDLGYGEEFFEAFIDPTIETMSQGEHTEIVAPSMKGHAVKLFNMSPQSVDYYW